MSLSIRVLRVHSRFQIVSLSSAFSAAKDVSGDSPPACLALWLAPPGPHSPGSPSRTVSTLPAQSSSRDVGPMTFGSSGIRNRRTPRIARSRIGRSSRFYHTSDTASAASFLSFASASAISSSVHNRQSSFSNRNHLFAVFSVMIRHFTLSTPFAQYRII